MKYRNIYILAMLAFSMNVWSQENQAMKRLMDYFKDKGNVNCFFIINNNSRLTKTFSISDMSSGANKQFKENLEQIISALNESRSNSAECCWWEKHSNGNDSMEVSIAFPHNGANTDIIYNIRNGRKNLISENYVSFRYAGKDSQRQQEMNLMYFCCVENTTLRGTTPIISENYEQAVFPIFNDKAIGKTPVNWIHDEACSDKAGIKENYILTTMKKANPAGSTTGYIFTIPVAEKDLAEKTLEKLVASTSEYLDAHPEQQYTLIHRLSGNRGNANAPSSIMNSGMQSEVQYDVLYGNDDDGYHFLFLKTDGSLWIPKQYSLLKNIKNYKKSYLKGKAKKK